MAELAPLRAVSTFLGGSIDAINGIMNLTKVQADVNQSQNLRDAIVNTLSADVKSEADYLLSLRNTPIQAILASATANTAGNLKYLLNELLDQAVQGVAGFPLSGAMIGQRAKIYSIVNQVDTDADLSIGIPAELLRKKALLYYNKAFAPNLPNERDAFFLSQNGDWNSNDFVSYLQETFGITESDAKQLLTIRQNQIGVPDLRTAFYMVNKGLMNQDAWLNIARFGYGFSKTNASVMFNALHYDFSPMELFRISDLMPIPDTWLSKKLDAMGLTVEDKAVMTQMIQARTLKDEIAQAWNILLDNYAWGLQTRDGLEQFLTANGIPDVQAKAKLVIADMHREKTVLKLIRDAEIYLYRKDVSDEDALLSALVTLDIELVVANAITRNEASKKGIDWEMP